MGPLAITMFLGVTLCSMGTWAEPPVTASDVDLLRPFNKPGECPVDVDNSNCKTANTDSHEGCNRDSQCPGKERCCFYGCKRQCLPPLEDKMDSCPNFDASICIWARPSAPSCHSDNQCPGSQRCCCTGCSMHCSETVKEKPGICPRVKVKCPSVPPKPNCKVDNDCNGKEKCCKRCAMTCVDPDEERPGFCPISRERLSCITTLDETICNKDSDCPKNQKCCLNKDQNQMVCLPSLKEKPGSCPKKIGVCHLPIKPKCKGDSYCPGDKKCCAPGCIAQCMDPITAVN